MWWKSPDVLLRLIGLAEDVGFLLWRTSSGISVENPPLTNRALERPWDYGFFQEGIFC